MLIAKTVYRIEDPEGRQWNGDRNYYRSWDEANARASDEAKSAGARPGYLRAVPAFVVEIATEKGPNVFVLLGSPVTVV